MSEGRLDVEKWLDTDDWRMLQDFFAAADERDGDDDSDNVEKYWSGRQPRTQPPSPS